MGGSYIHKKQCVLCNKEYIITSNRQKVCNDCKPKLDKKRQDQWREDNRERYNTYQNNYVKQISYKYQKNHNKNNPEYYRLACKDYAKRTDYEAQKKYHKHRYKNDPEYRKYCKIRKREYRRTENGGLVEKKAQAKRKRNLKFIPLFLNPFPKDIKVHYHHINNLLVIPMPGKTHLKDNSSKTKHLEHNKQWIDKLYCLDINVFLFSCMEDSYNYYNNTHGGF